MAHFDTWDERGASPNKIRSPVFSDAPTAAVTERTLLYGQAAEFVFRVPAGSVIALGGIDAMTLRDLIDQAANISNGRRALFVRLRPTGSVETYVEQVITVLAETAQRLWPVWFSDVSFAMCRDDVLGHQAAGMVARETASRVPGVSSTWAEAAARLALAGRLPRVASALPAIELAQLSLVISRVGLVLVVDVSAAGDVRSALVLARALEWMAQHSRAAVVVLFPELPPLGSPFDRILYGARHLIDDANLDASVPGPEARESVGWQNWLAPWRGSPHPLSEIEQRLAEMLSEDAELASLFCFNWIVDTVRGSRPRVDLVWLDGRLVVELDGYPDHATRGAFIRDRHRDYELALSGYTVLRLANDEVVQDFGRAIEKIRDLVRLRQTQVNRET
jgi:very-short-patch-repair endonuclease